MEKYKPSVDLTMLALTVWREARGESTAAQLGVAFVVKTRAAQPGWWGKDILSVVTKKLQFTSMTMAADPQTTTWPSWSDPSWLAVLDVAAQVLGGTVENPAPDADSYYDISIPAPKWALSGKFITQLGKIRFYRVRP